MASMLITGVIGRVFQNGWINFLSTAPRLCHPSPPMEKRLCCSLVTRRRSAEVEMDCLISMTLKAHVLQLICASPLLAGTFHRYHNYSLVPVSTITWKAISIAQNLHGIISNPYYRKKVIQITPYAVMSQNSPNLKHARYCSRKFSRNAAQGSGRAC